MEEHTCNALMVQLCEWKQEAPLYVTARHPGKGRAPATVFYECAQVKGRDAFQRNFRRDRRISDVHCNCCRRLQCDWLCLLIPRAFCTAQLANVSRKYTRCIHRKGLFAIECSIRHSTRRQARSGTAAVPKRALAIIAGQRTISQKSRPNSSGPFKAATSERGDTLLVPFAANVGCRC